MSTIKVLRMKKMFLKLELMLYALAKLVRSSLKCEEFILHILTEQSEMAFTYCFLTASLSKVIIDFMNFRFDWLHTTCSAEMPVCERQLVFKFSSSD